MLGATLTRIAAHTASLARRAGAADFPAQADQGAKRLVGQALPQFIEARQVGAGVHAASDSVAVALTVDSMR